MRGRVLGVICAIAGCGRIGFDANGGDDMVDDALGSGGDGPMGTPEMLTFPAAADTALNSFAPLANYGAGLTFNVRSDALSTYVALLRFDISGATGTVTGATLRISTGNQAFTSGRVDIAPVLEAWVEGTETGMSGVANYGVREGAMQWTTMGCGPGSREATPIASMQPTSTNTRYEVVLPPSVVQAWIDGTVANHGFALFATGSLNDTVVFYARESTMPAELIVHVVR